MAEGVWRTISGRRVFIKEGQSVSDAMKASGKFKKSSKKDNNSPASENNLDYSNMEKGSQEALKSFVNRSTTYENMMLKHGKTLDETLAVAKDELKRWYSLPYPDKPNVYFKADPKDYDKVINQYSRYLKYQVRGFIKERENYNKNGFKGPWSNSDIKKFKAKNKDIFK